MASVALSVIEIYLNDGEVRVLLDLNQIQWAKYIMKDDGTSYVEVFFIGQDQENTLKIGQRDNPLIAYEAIATGLKDLGKLSFHATSG